MIWNPTHSPVGLPGRSNEYKPLATDRKIVEKKAKGITYPIFITVRYVSDRIASQTEVARASDLLMAPEDAAMTS